MLCIVEAIDWKCAMTEEQWRIILRSDAAPRINHNTTRSLCPFVLGGILGLVQNTPLGMLHLLSCHYNLSSLDLANIRHQLWGIFNRSQINMGLRIKEMYKRYEHTKSSDNSHDRDIQCYSNGPLSWHHQVDGAKTLNDYTCCTLLSPDTVLQLIVYKNVPPAGLCSWGLLSSSLSWASWSLSSSWRFRAAVLAASSSAASWRW